MFHVLSLVLKAKRESGENPERSRHCNRRVSVTESLASCAVLSSTGILPGRKIGALLSLSQETCMRWFLFGDGPKKETGIVQQKRAVRFA